MDDADSLIEKLILDGLVEPAAIDSNTGEILFSFTDKVREEYPAMYKSVMEEFYNDINYLWEKGYLNITITDDNPMVTITEKALNKEEVDKLPYQLQVQLTIILEALRID